MKLFATRLILLLFVTPIFSQHIDIHKNKLSFLTSQESLNDIFMMDRIIVEDGISEQQYLKKICAKRLLD
ncbi:hypothetical protein [Patiriisocius sp. Uisw_017]|uniref:hypothetical protein n=1 Tax=Patiriisocius sp. Uisw_017 TaxID=3230968 RepID=UPI0039EA6E01